MSQKITKEMTFREALNLKPDSAHVMLQYGLHCIGCHMNASESIEQGAAGHGLTTEEIDKMVEEINNLD